MPRPDIAFRVGTPGDTQVIATVHRRSILGLGGIDYAEAQLASWTSRLHPERYVQGMASGQGYLAAKAPGGGLLIMTMWLEQRLDAAT